MMEMIQLELTLQESQTLEQCETVIERELKAFVRVGNALLTIRDGRLYREEYDTWDEYLRGRWDMERTYAHRVIDAATVAGNLLPIGNIQMPASEHQSRPLTRLEPEQQREAWAQVVEEAERTNGKITGALVQEVVDRMQGRGALKRCDVCGNVWDADLSHCPYCTIPREQRVAYAQQERSQPHVAHNSGNNEWYTPPQYIDAARQVMGEIDLDPASSGIANEIVQARTYYTAQESGLERDWSGRMWMNPPYSSDLIGGFADKLAYHVQEGDVTEACVLVNNATETGWFNTLMSVAECVCLIRGRVKFIDENGRPSGAPLQGQVVLYSGPNVDRFAQAFGPFGPVMQKVA